MSGAGVQAPGSRPAEPDDLQLRTATPADVAPLASLYSAAFEANPAYRWIFTGSPDQPAPPGALEWLFTRRVRLLLQCGCPLLVAVDLGSGALVGAAALSPFSRKPGMWHFLQHGIALWPLWYGWASFSRVLNIDKKLARLVAAGGSGGGGGSGGASRDGHDPASSTGGGRAGREGITGELVMMVVAPALQGRGIGRRLLRALLALWDDEHGGGLVLATQEAHALRLYRAHGFTEPEGAAEAEEAGPAAASADCSGAGSTATAGTPAEGTGPSPEAVPAYKSWVLVRPAQPPAGAASSEQ